MKKGKDDDLFDEGDPFDDPRWKEAEKKLATKTEHGKFISFPALWLKRVLPYTKSATQLAVMLLLQRHRFLCSSRTFSLPNKALEELGISRQAKYRALAGLELAKLIRTNQKPGRAVVVTLLE
jgi:hypothetical protein